MKKKQPTTTTSPETKQEQGISFDKEKDFEFVQLDKSIHDTKFETKPTTYFKDAFKRFCKSKSSVTAAGILGILILMAIFVPIIDGNNIESANIETTLLPPKWFENTNGFLDGTGYVEDVVLDPSTDLPADNNGVTIYFPDAIQGEITREETTMSDTLTPNVLDFGKGGYVAWTYLGGSQEATFSSPAIEMRSNSVIDISYVTDGEERPDLSFTGYISTGMGEEEENFDLSFTKEGNTYSTSWDNTTSNTSFYLNFELSGNEVWMSSLSIKVDGEEAMLSTTEMTINQETGRQEMVEVPAGILEPKDFIYNNLVDESNVIPDDSTWTSAGGTWAIKEIVVTTGSFRYDYYKGVYGEDIYEYNKQEIDTFIANGWIEPTFTWTNTNMVNGEWAVDDAAVGFKLTELGEQYCPLREVTTEKSQYFYSMSGGHWSQSVVGTRSRYRDFYFKGFIAECKPVNFILGTNNEGVDFFKLLFSGLLTSLELGLLASVINIVIGVVWGSISGYFGGTVDLLMERFTEILGGMPWIVLMTLIVLLLGSNFWTFLLALCLTGWIGTSATTRAQFYRFKGREYVLAARTLGASDSRLIFRHILPNGIGTIITGSILMIPSVIFQEATISYLLPNVLSFQGTSFGVTLSRAQSYIYTAPYLIISGSIVMAIIMICFNLFGNGLRDAFNPSLKGGNE